MSKPFPYKTLNRQQLISKINGTAASKTPFLFVIDYKAESGYVIKAEELDEEFVRFEIQEPRTKSQESRTKSQEPGSKNQESGSKKQIEKIQWKLLPLSVNEYQSKFENVQAQIHQGNSFLTNLTQPTEINTDLTLFDLFQLGSAKYKLWIKDRFTMLSPETFIQINNRMISSFPMKGTIDASIPNAENQILNDSKEKAEHATIVDLIRNDLSIVAQQVEVTRYRYVEKIKTNKQELLQVSSRISGYLPENYNEHLGDIIFSLLPAGSISGAPKAKTLEIIDRAEGYERGFYTGICGWFDGSTLDSAVMIRFLEQQGDKLIFKSGGGITAQSDLQKEYEELIQKAYVPVY